MLPHIRDLSHNRIHHDKAMHLICNPHRWICRQNFQAEAETPHRNLRKTRLGTNIFRSLNNILRMNPYSY